jgi:NAD(P)-dependent dehydrogenase (short-subunit alcohol dehydrogenase family)
VGGEFNNLFSVEEKVTLVTGGSRGIGEMIAAGFLSAGARVYISSRHGEACAATAKRLAEKYRGVCIALPADLSQMSGVESLVRKIGEHETHVDVLVNNAGTAWGAPLESFPEIGWDKVMDTNLKAVFFLTQRLLPMLRQATQSGTPSRVINIGSIDGMKCSAFDNFSYGASKAALHHLTRFMATHLTRERILFNAIAPGPFPTRMLSLGVGLKGETDDADWSRVSQYNPSGRVGTAQDIAGLAIFLSSRAGEYVIGQTIACDGGIVACS